jgi:hypothetical protein
MVSGFTGRQTSVPAAHAWATGRAADGLGAVEGRQLAREQAELEELAEALADLGEQRARGDRDDDAVGRRPPELLADLVGQRLGALGVVRAQVDVDERPRLVLARQLGAQAVDVVVVAVDRHDVRAVDARGEDLLLLEVGRDEDEGLHPERGRLGGHGVGQVARGGAGQDLEARGRGHRPTRPRRRGP